MDTAPVLEAMRGTARTLRSGDARSRVRAVQCLQDALDAVKAECLAELETTKDFEIDGASTLNTWVRNELRFVGQGRQRADPRDVHPGPTAGGG